MRYQINDLNGGSFTYTVLFDVPPGGNVKQAAQAAAQAELARRGYHLPVKSLEIVCFGLYNTRAEFESVYGPRDPWRGSFEDYGQLCP